MDGGWGEAILQQRLDKFKAAIPNRHAIFGGMNWGWRIYGLHLPDDVLAKVY